MATSSWPPGVLPENTLLKGKNSNDSKLFFSQQKSARHVDNEFNSAVYEELEDFKIYKDDGTLRPKNIRLWISISSEFAAYFHKGRTCFSLMRRQSPSLSFTNHSINMSLCVIAPLPLTLQGN